MARWCRPTMPSRTRRCAPNPEMLTRNRLPKPSHYFAFACTSSWGLCHRRGVHSGGQATPREACSCVHAVVWGCVVDRSIECGHVVLQVVEIIVQGSEVTVQDVLRHQVPTGSPLAHTSSKCL